MSVCQLFIYSTMHNNLNSASLWRTSASHKLIKAFCSDKYQPRNERVLCWVLEEFALPVKSFTTPTILQFSHKILAIQVFFFFKGVGSLKLKNHVQLIVNKLFSGIRKLFTYSFSAAVEVNKALKVDANNSYMCANCARTSKCCILLSEKLK